MENYSRISLNSSKNPKPLSNIIFSSENNIFNSILFFDLDLAFIKSNDKYYKFDRHKIQEINNTLYSKYND